MDKRYQYDSVNNPNYIGSINVQDEREKTSCKVPLILLAPTLLFAAFVGHIATIAYVGTRAEVAGTSLSTNAIHTIKNDPVMAQQYAEDHFKKNLFTPSKLAEEFYANSGTDKNKDGAVMSSTDPAPEKPPEDGCLATIMLLRHCEAGAAREHCGYMGNLRSEYIATLFGKSADDRWPEPSYIYALAAGERHNEYVKNWREIETVVPLSEKVNVTIDKTYAYPEKKDLIKHLYNQLKSGNMCGKLTVISWKHHDIPKFAHSLGCGPENGCPMTYGEFDYDDIWEITYSYHKEKYAPYVVEDNTEHGKKKRHPWGKYPEWFVYGAIQKEKFDPLIFVNKSNDSN
jgi:hypothetical protein